MIKLIAVNLMDIEQRFKQELSKNSSEVKDIMVLEADYLVGKCSYAVKRVNEQLN